MDQGILIYEPVSKTIYCTCERIDIVKVEGAVSMLVINLKNMYLD